MKKKTLLILVNIVAIIVIIAVIVFAALVRKPFKSLSADEITSATVHLSPPDKTIEITDLDKLCGYLRDVVIYNKDNSYTDYMGQGVVFTLEMNDGTQKEVMAYNPFVVIDGVGYKTKYQPCDALSSYANSLLNGDAAVVLDEPPTLTVVSGQAEVSTLRGGYSWEKLNSDGTAEAVVVDSVHPLDCEERLTLLETDEPTATLNFAQQPDEIVSVRCWSDEYFGDTTAESEDTAVDGNVLTLKSGGYVYEITARWSTDGKSGGTAGYYVYIKSE